MNNIMNIQTIDISKLKPSTYNPREISKEEFEGLKESLKTFGQQENLIVNKDMTIISGHQRFEAMKALGWTEAVCNMVDLDKHQEKKLNVIMNSTAISGKYDDLKLSEILEELKLDDDYESLRLNALEPLDLSGIEVEEDEAPEVSSEPPVSKLGEVYQLGRHRVMCGDSTVKENVEMLMNGDKAGMVFTDPPYNFEGEGAGFLKSSTANMRDRVKDIIDFEPNSIDFIKDLDVHSFLFFCNKALIPMYLDIFKGYTFDVLVWHKTNPTPFTSNGFLPDIEYLLMFTRKGRVWNNSLKPTSVYSKVYSSAKLEGREGAGDVHPTMKPIKLLADKMRVCSSKNGGVLDLFLGSGSTLIACEQTDRTCYGMELDPKYVDVIRKRYWKFTHDGNEEGWEDGTKAV